MAFTLSSACPARTPLALLHSSYGPLGSLTQSGKVRKSKGAINPGIRSPRVRATRRPCLFCSGELTSPSSFLLATAGLARPPARTGYSDLESDRSMEKAPEPRIMMARAIAMANT